MIKIQSSSPHILGVVCRWLRVGIPPSLSRQDLGIGSEPNLGGGRSADPTGDGGANMEDDEGTA
jgi:hypothetical protein